MQKNICFFATNLARAFAVRSGARRRILRAEAWSPERAAKRRRVGRNADAQQNRESGALTLNNEGRPSHLR
jgi:hypothetical protein